MNKPAEMVVGGAVGGASPSELLEIVIAESKKVLAFKYVSKELASAMEDLRRVIIQVEFMQKDAEELKRFMDTIERVRKFVSKCSKVKWWNPVTKSRYTKEIVLFVREMNWFCQLELGTILLRTKLRFGPPVLSGPSSVPKLQKDPVGLELPLMELKKKLLDDAVTSLLVSAPPGCGKTTLVTLLCNDEEIKGEFKNIFYAVVSSTPNFRVIIQNLLQHNGYLPRTFENDSQASNALRNLLETLSEAGTILLVLDDVWNGAELFLEKFQINLPDYKILVTSRFDLPSFDSSYHLKPLEEEDAKALFIERAPRPYNASIEEYEDLLQKILRCCNGFPLLIVVLGASLKGRPLNRWKEQVESWVEGSTIIDFSHPIVLERLQPSFNALKSHLKECFLDMGSFLEDQKIRASVIIDIWVELYGEGDSILCMKYLEDLAYPNLLELVPLRRNEHEDGFYNEFLVTQHDILRELAIYQNKLEAESERKRLNLEIKKDKFPDWCFNPVQPIINARLLSISTDDLFSSSWVEMDFPNVEALVLHISSSDYALPSFIAGMMKLKVLIITNHGFYPARLRNFSCLRSLPNLKRIRLEKALITLDILQLQLISLEKLSLFMCNFSELFYDVEDMDVSIALPRLQEIDIDYCYDLDELPYWISEVVSLKTLSITNGNKLCSLPEEIGNLSNLEVLRLSSCVGLSALPKTIERLSNLRFLDISDCIELRKLPQDIGKLQKLKKISMRKCRKCELPDSLKNLEDLLVKIDEDSAVMWKRLKPIMRNLIVIEET